MTEAKYHPREVHFRNWRIEEALYTDFGANRETPKICCRKVTKSYNACNLWQRQNTTPESYIFVISASRRPYILILGQIERPQKSAAEMLQKVTCSYLSYLSLLVACDWDKIPTQRGTFSQSAHQGGPIYRYWGKSRDPKNLLQEGYKKLQRL